MKPILTPQDRADFGKVPDKVIADRRGVSISAVAQARRKAEIPAFQRQSPRRPITEEDLREAQRLYDEGVPDAEIAARLGRHKTFLHRYREVVRQNGAKDPGGNQSVNWAKIAAWLNGNP